METIEAAMLSAGVVLIGIAAWQDFRNWKIPNLTVLLALFAWLGFALARWAATPTGVLAELGPSPLIEELVGGIVLFITGAGLWALRLLGAGDAKLMLPVGLFVGFIHLPLFASFLLAAGVVLALLMRFPVPHQLLAWNSMLRIEEIRQTRKIPYGVVIALAAFFALYNKYV